MPGYVWAVRRQQLFEGRPACRVLGAVPWHIEHVAERLAAGERVCGSLQPERRVCIVEFCKGIGGGDAGLCVLRVAAVGRVGDARQGSVKLLVGPGDFGMPQLVCGEYKETISVMRKLPGRLHKERGQHIHAVDFAFGGGAARPPVAKGRLPRHFQFGRRFLPENVAGALVQLLPDGIKLLQLVLVVEGGEYGNRSAQGALHGAVAACHRLGEQLLHFCHLCLVGALFWHACVRSSLDDLGFNHQIACL